MYEHYDADSLSYLRLLNQNLFVLLGEEYWFYIGG